MKKAFRVAIAIAIVLLLCLFFWAWLRYWDTICGASLFEGFLGAAVGGFFAAILAWIAYKELSGIGKTNRTDFIHRLRNDFFVEETRILVDHITEDRLLYTQVPAEVVRGEEDATSSHNEMRYFEVDLRKILPTFPKELQDQLTRKRYYLEVEVDDFLLGHFEDIGLFEEKGLIDTEMTYEEFSYYIFETFENPEIKKYLNDADFCDWEFDSMAAARTSQTVTPGELYRIISGEVLPRQPIPSNPSVLST